MFTADIDEYNVTYSSNTFRPRIGLKSKGNYVAQLTFHHGSDPLPEDGEKNGEYQLHYRLEDFANMINLLRNEAPAQFVFVGNGGGNENAIRFFNGRVGGDDKE